MRNHLTNRVSRANQRYWDAMASAWQTMRDQDQLWRLCPLQPDLAFEGEALAFIRKYAGQLLNQRVLVIGGGDNYAAFALAGLGAQVTSTDLSTHQLEIARQRADQLGLKIEFVGADAAHLECLQDNSFDLVCSTNGFFVWISEPGQVFQEVKRVLKSGGYYIFYDIHPFLRPWKSLAFPLEMEKPYFMTGPFEDEYNGETCYEFHWRLSDLLNPLLNAGLTVCQIAESPANDARFWEGYAYTAGREPGLLDWRNNPRAGLPVWLTVAARKTG